MLRLAVLLLCTSLTESLRALVTGGSGFLGRELVGQLLDRGHSVVSCGRTPVALDHTNFDNRLCYVADEGAMFAAVDEHKPDVLYSAAGVFRKSGVDDVMADMVKPNLEIANVAVAAAARAKAHLVLTSSMAAVRGPGQAVRAGAVGYDSTDWNTVSRVDQGWSGAHQYSKCESEIQAWLRSESLGIGMTTLCPSKIYGPAREQLPESSYSVQLVKSWFSGQAAVESRLCVDVRDCAEAHVIAGEKRLLGRYLVTHESRLPAETLAAKLREIDGSGNVYADDWTGTVKIGDQECVASGPLLDDLGITLRPEADTLGDMCAQIAAES